MRRTQVLAVGVSVVVFIGILLPSVHAQRATVSAVDAGGCPEKPPCPHDIKLANKPSPDSSAVKPAAAAGGCPNGPPCPHKSKHPKKPSDSDAATSSGNGDRRPPKTGDKVQATASSATQ